jgi:hypothetical protein
VDAGYPDNADLIISEGRPVLMRRAGRDRRASALAPETAVHERLPQRDLLEILACTAYQTGWPRHFGPVSGSDPKLRDVLGRYVATAFCYGTYLGPAELARHMPRQVTARELARAFHQHCGQDRLQTADTDVINAFTRLDIASLWGGGSAAGADGSQISTWENNLLAETSILYGSAGKIAYRHIADTYVALFTRFIPCGCGRRFIPRRALGGLPQVAGVPTRVQNSTTAAVASSWILLRGQRIASGSLLPAART